MTLQFVLGTVDLKRPVVDTEVAQYTWKSTFFVQLDPLDFEENHMPLIFFLCCLLVFPQADTSS